MNVEKQRNRLGGVLCADGGRGCDELDVQEEGLRNYQGSVASSQLPQRCQEQWLGWCRRHCLWMGGEVDLVFPDLYISGK